MILTIQAQSVKNLVCIQVLVYIREITNLSLSPAPMTRVEFSTIFLRTSIRDNELFQNSYTWLLSTMKNELFDSIEEFLIHEQSFIQSKRGLVKNEVCSLVAIHQRRKKSLKGEIRDLFQYNLFKFRDFQNIVNVTKQVTPLIYEVITRENLTKSDVLTACNDKGSL